MSSAPAGLHALEYGYSTFDYTLPPGAGLQTISARGRWAITKISVWASSAPNCRISINRDSSTMDIAPNGCLVLEPNGAYRGPINVRGDGMRVLIEYWWKPTPDALPPLVTV